jgi:serine/threonine-protein kinase
VPVLRNHDTVIPSVSPTTVLMREPPQRKRGLAYLLLGVATVAVFLIALVAASSLLGSSSKDLSTPDLRHQLLADAQATLISQGLKVGTITYKYTGKNNKGLVIKQNPAPGIFLRKGQAVSLTVSQGIKIVSVPLGLRGQTLDGAKSALIAAGLRVGTIVQKNSSAPANQVLGSRPAAGQQLPAGTKVSLIISNAHVKVPDVTLKDPATASNILLQAGFNPIVRRAAVYTHLNDGLIVSQTPSGGTFAASGSTVIIYLDKKVKPSPSPSQSTSPSATPTNSTSPTATPTH